MPIGRLTMRSWASLERLRVQGLGVLRVGRFKGGVTVEGLGILGVGGV